MEQAIFLEPKSHTGCPHLEGIQSTNFNQENSFLGPPTDM